jgi:hypothetical protein
MFVFFAKIASGSGLSVTKTLCWAGFDGLKFFLVSYYLIPTIKVPRIRKVSDIAKNRKNAK